MSSALVRQALEFVDPDESSAKRKKRSGTRHQGASGQDLNLVLQKHKKSKKNKHITNQSPLEKDNKATQEVITKLLKLSKPTLDKETANKIVKRASAGKPVADEIKIKKDKQKSILFPEEDFKQFEK